jgi:transposase-like protein
VLTRAAAKIYLESPRVRRCPSGRCLGSRCSKKGYFKTKWNAQPVARYRCARCGRYFSSHTFRKSFGQKRPDLNDKVFQLYASGMTQRRMAIVLGVNRKTIVRKFLFVSGLARKEHERRIGFGDIKTTQVQFDEMESFEHTRLKPLTIAVAVRAKSGEIIDLRVETLSYKGPLAGLAFKKYGPRKNNAAKAVGKVLSTVALCTTARSLITTDSHPSYPKLVTKWLPLAVHKKSKRCPPVLATSRRNPHDELYTLNYSIAKIRNDLSRLSRKTWVTTKKPERLQAHLDLYMAWNNRYQIAS